MLIKRAIFLIVIILFLVACTQYVWAFSLFSTSTEEEVAIGRRIAKSIEKKMPIYKDIEDEKRLIKVGYSLVRVCGRKDLEYTFTIIDKDEINAFATFGGFIYINKGVMDRARTDDELAAVLAHETGHVSAKHLTKRLEQSRMFSFGFFALDALVLRKHKSRRDIHRVVNVAYDIIQRGYSREDELEADRLGARYSYYAGYDPLAAISMMKKLKEEKRKKGSPSIFENIDLLRTHPYLDNRMDAVFSEYADIKADEAFEKQRR